MFKSIFRRQIKAMENTYGYDATYMHEILSASTGAFFKFGLFQSMSQHQGPLPKEAALGVRLASALVEDCGPCVQIVVDMFLHQNVSAPIIEALLKGDIDAAGPDAALAFKLGDAAARNLPEAVELSAQAEARWGKEGLVALAFGAASARVYPTVKRAMGHGAICARVRVGDRNIEVKHAA